MSSNGTDTDGKLRTFEKNRYFHGKLMTARDMQAEQEYHADRLEATNRHVTGEGIVCGLDVSSVTQTGRELSVELEPGFALDCHGNPITVTGEGPIAVNDPDTNQSALPSGENPIYLYLRYDECSVETVPKPGSGNACEEECTYNRILEVFDVVFEEVEAEDQPPKGHKPVPDIGFPEPDDVAAENGAVAPGDPGLLKMAREYYEENLSECERCTHPWVFLGTFTGPDSDGGWNRTASDPTDGSLVYTNDLLYAAVARHAARFDNPHQVTLQTEDRRSESDDESAGGDGPGARVFVKDELELPEQAVEVTSDDGNVDIAVPGTKQLDFQIPDLQPLLQRVDRLERILTEVQRRIPPLERYVMGKTMRFKRESYGEIAGPEDESDRKLAQIVALEIVQRTRGWPARRSRTTLELFRELFMENQSSIVLAEEGMDGAIDDGVLTLEHADTTYEIEFADHEFGEEEVEIDDERVTIRTSLYGLERLFGDLLEGVEGIVELGIETYRSALADLAEAVAAGDGGASGADVLTVVVLQDRLSEVVADLRIEDTRGPGRVFLGDRDVDLSRYRGAPFSGEVLLVGVSGDAAGTEVTNEDVMAADITAENGFATGDYRFSDTEDGPPTLTVVEPVMSDLELRLAGRDVRGGTVPRGTRTPIKAIPQFNFAEVERVEITLTDGDGVDNTDRLTDDRFVTQSGDAVLLRVSGMEVGSYTVTARGEEHLVGEERSAEFEIVAEEIDIDLNPATVTWGHPVHGEVSSNRDGNVFILIGRLSIFDNTTAQDVIDVVTGSTERFISEETHVGVEVGLEDGLIQFKLNTGRFVSESRQHGVAVSTSKRVRDVVATAVFRIRGDPIIVDSIDNDGPIIRDPIDFDNPIVGPFDPRSSGTIFGGGGMVIHRDDVPTDGVDEASAEVFIPIDGIGRVRSQQLSEAGITTLRELVEADLEAVANLTNTSIHEVRSWAFQAEDRLEE